MTDERIINELSRLDKYSCTVTEILHRNEDSVYCKLIGGDNTYLPNYLNDHNACQRVIDGMTETEGITYFKRLRYAVNSRQEFVKATPRQKCEAILKAYGKWEEGE